ncbi:hypothetical protein F2P81_023065 [Scophthalmus maximus]|uniref:Uncharacterized protein n=1 Tax=Scophthalmus maximus TaxID=52904 RepID=A0A6A4RQJ1_SCOMX|nr:hypothetical protein F2P81_023065 [Scophthalmus maximus]
MKLSNCAELKTGKQPRGIAEHLLLFFPSRQSCEDRGRISIQVQLVSLIHFTETSALHVKSHHSSLKLGLNPEGPQNTGHRWGKRQHFSPPPNSKAKKPHVRI